MKEKHRYSVIFLEGALERNLFWG